MSSDLTKRVNFDLLRYANCWEDVDILLKGLDPDKGSKILSIGSAGDNSFSLLITDPEVVVAVDVNKIQLYLIGLKKACIKNLTRHETLCFLGFLPSETREEIFNRIKIDLEQPTRLYWETKIDLIKAGIIYQGKFEKYFQLFSQKVLPWIHSRKTVEALLSQKTASEQIHFYNKVWNTWRWKLLFRIFFSRYLMGKLGRDPEFLKEVKGSVSDFIYNKATEHLKSISAQSNYILRYNLTGNFGELLPHYLLEEHYDVIKSNIDKLVLHEGFAQSAIAEFGPFNHMNMSDIFEYMDDALFKSTAASLLKGTVSGGKIAYWNLMVPRKISGILPEKAEYLGISKKLTAMDKGFFYKEFIIEQRKGND